MSDFKEKVRSIAAPRKWGSSRPTQTGAQEVVPVLNEKDGHYAGHHVKHWDGRQDARVVQEKPINLKLKMEEA